VANRCTFWHKTKSALGVHSLTKNKRKSNNSDSKVKRLESKQECIFFFAFQKASLPIILDLHSIFFVMISQIWIWTIRFFPLLDVPFFCCFSTANKMLLQRFLVPIFAPQAVSSHWSRIRSEIFGKATKIQGCDFFVVFSKCYLKATAT